MNKPQSVVEQVWDRVWSQESDQVWLQVSDQVRGQVWGQVEDEMFWQVWEQVRNHAQVDVMMWNKGENN